MNSLLIKRGRVLLPSGWAAEVDVRLGGELIERIGPCLPHSGCTTIDAKDLLVVPGFIDVHIHGAAGAMCEDADARALERIATQLPRFGVTGFLATVATLPPERLRAAVRTIAEAPKTTGASILGIHLEGPYLNPARAGAQARGWMRKPSIEELDVLLDLAGGQIRLITVAPELEGALPLVAAARARGVNVALGHTNATAEEAGLAVQAGASHVTHLFNAMGELHHRDTGILGVALTEDQLSVELICDGHHVAPRAIDLALRCKPPGKIVLVSDAVGALGLPDGDYEVFGMPCTIGGGAVRLRQGGTLAGSCLGLDRAVRNLHHWFPDVATERFLAAASTAPAAVIGDTRRGRIAEGTIADLLLMDANLEALATIVAGKIVWQRSPA